MSALDKIAELHWVALNCWEDRPCYWMCVECGSEVDGPDGKCPTRRLCDEAAERNTEFTVEVRAIVDDQLMRRRDLAVADAATLAAAWADFLAFWPEAYGMDELTAYIQRGTAALAAHDALTAETETQ